MNSEKYAICVHLPSGDRSSPVFMSKISKRHRTNFTRSQKWKRLSAYQQRMSIVWGDLLDKRLVATMLTGSDKSSYTEPTGSEDV